MWDMLTSPETREIAGIGLAWAITASLLLAGLIGCLIPVLPGHLLLFLAAVSHRLMLGADESGLAWWSFLILGAMMAASQAIEMLSGAAGAKWFGGTKWGALGAFVGALAGLFFMPIGLIAGPLVGAFGFEMAFAKKEAKPAMASGMGSVAGTVIGMVVKVFFGVLMVAWFLLDVFLIG
jgi:uncharacterized protein YqgC (DUF456 family)